MSDLTEGGKRLVKAGRQADRPSDADRERVRALLSARLGDAALLTTTLSEAPPPNGGVQVLRAKLVKWGWVGSTVLVAGVAWFVPRFAHQSEQHAPAASASALTPVRPASAAASPALPELPATTAPLSSPSATRVVPPDGTSHTPDSQKGAPRTRDRLAEEVALLSRAETELHAGRPAKALVALAEHQSKFPRGALAEERTAARIQALCALGRTDEANLQLRQLLHISPNSALEERTRQACREPRSTAP